MIKIGNYIPHYTGVSTSWKQSHGGYFGGLTDLEGVATIVDKGRSAKVAGG